MIYQYYLERSQTILMLFLLAFLFFSCTKQMPLAFEMEAATSYTLQAGKPGGQNARLNSIDKNATLETNALCNSKRR